MCIERLETATIKPRWTRPATNMSVRYLAHPDLRLAFVQIVEEADWVYVISDEPLPASFEDAVAAVEQWRRVNG